MTTVLRRLAASDELGEAAKLFDAYRQFYRQPSDLGAARMYLAVRLQREESVVYLAEVDGRAVGFMQLYPSFCSIAIAPIWVLNDLYVAPDLRGRGVAGALLEEARRLGRSSGAAYLQLSTAHENLAAQRVYEAHGWVYDTVYRYYTIDC